MGSERGLRDHSRRWKGVAWRRGRLSTHYSFPSPINAPLFHLTYMLGFVVSFHMVWINNVNSTSHWDDITFISDPSYKSPGGYPYKIHWHISYSPTLKAYLLNRPDIAWHTLFTVALSGKVIQEKINTTSMNIEFWPCARHQGYRGEYKIICPHK